MLSELSLQLKLVEFVELCFCLVQCKKKFGCFIQDVAKTVAQIIINSLEQFLCIVLSVIFFLNSGSTSLKRTFTILAELFGCIKIIRFWGQYRILRRQGVKVSRRQGVCWKKMKRPFLIYYKYKQTVYFLKSGECVQIWD